MFLPTDKCCSQPSTKKLSLPTKIGDGRDSRPPKELRVSDDDELSPNEYTCVHPKAQVALYKTDWKECKSQR